MGNAVGPGNAGSSLQFTPENFEDVVRPLVGRFVGIYGPHGFELIDVSMQQEPLCLVATKLTGDPNVPAGEITWELSANNTARGRVAETGFVNPLWIPGFLEWDTEDPEEVKFHWAGCGGVSYLRVPNSFQLDTPEAVQNFIALNYTRIFYAHGYYHVLPKHKRRVTDAALEKLTKVKFNPSSTGPERCTICLVDFVEGEEVVILPCNHVFHLECCVKWLKQRDACPLCNKAISTFESNPKEPNSS